MIIQITTRLSYVLAVTFLLAGCGNFDKDDAREIVNRVGVKEILRDAQLLGKYTDKRVPKEAWPKSIRALEPVDVRIGQDGVSVSKYKYYVQEEGIYIVFEGARSPKTEVGSDPSYTKIADGIYWYSVAG